MMNMNMNMMSDPSLAGMLPFDTMGLYEPPKPRFIFKMPRVIPDQKNKFESDDLFRKMSRDGEIRYAELDGRPLEERKSHFTNSFREGRLNIAFRSCGIHFQLIFNPNPLMYQMNNYDREMDFEKEPGKVHIKSSFILNGVCVRFRGWLDLERLDGIGRLEYDERRGSHEDAILKEQLERYSQRLKDFEDSKQSINVGGNRGSWRQ